MAKRTSTSNGQTVVPPPQCENTATAIQYIKQMFVDTVQYGRIQGGQTPAKRAAFVTLHGSAFGTFKIDEDLDEEYRMGIFQPGREYTAWVRYSSDIADGIPDKGSTVGIGIKLFGVEGKKALEEDADATTMDLVLQNMDVFFASDAMEMCEFKNAALKGPDTLNAWLADHPETAKILTDMRKDVPSMLESELWSCIPYHFDDGIARYCKYKLVAEPDGLPAPAEVDRDDPHYLQVELERRLKSGPARLGFMVQLRNSPTQLLDNARDRWDETTAVPKHVATLTLPQQDITERGQREYGEVLSYNPWRALEVHMPTGTIAEVRKVVYQASAGLRRHINGQTVGEPVQPRPPGPPSPPFAGDDHWPPARDNRIVRAAIHPGIGIARVGNSTQPDGFYIGPEVVSPPRTEPGATRDDKGAIKRQAARFRLYGYNAAGEVVQELTPDNASIAWQVHLANKKPQWFEFDIARDIDEGAAMKAQRRNAAVKGDARKTLAIDPGPVRIAGKSTSGANYQFDQGTFLTTPVTLGELRTDETGRLLVLGGMGKSASPGKKPLLDPDNPNGLNNSANWYDDTSDGPVTATVDIDGVSIPVDPAWVVVAPPNFAPDLVSFRTLYDMLVDSYIEAGWMAMPEEISFARHVLPALKRLSGLQWVNAGFAHRFGKGMSYDFDDPATLEKLARKPAGEGSDIYAQRRREVFQQFRPPDIAAEQPSLWPQIYGDTFANSGVSAPNNQLPVSAVRYEALRRWAQGDFIGDWNPDDQAPQTVEELDLPAQPAMLDEAALQFCVADAFHPGCELTWPMRHATLYRAPFRIRQRPADMPEPDYGEQLDTRTVLRPGGPLYEQGPGDLSRWMALPWQGDTARCRSGYDPEYDPYLPAFWPARVPNHVLVRQDYDTIMNPASTADERMEAFLRRPNWLRDILEQNGKPAEPEQVLMAMVQHFADMGIVEARPGPTSDPDIPSVLYVESLPADGQKSSRYAAMIRTSENAKAAATPEDRLRQAGWASEEQRQAFRRLL